MRQTSNGWAGVFLPSQRAGPVPPRRAQTRDLTGGAQPGAQTMLKRQHPLKLQSVHVSAAELPDHRAAAFFRLFAFSNSPHKCVFFFLYSSSMHRGTWSLSTPAWIILQPWSYVPWFYCSVHKQPCFWITETVVVWNRSPGRGFRPIRVSAVACGYDCDYFHCLRQSWARAFVNIASTTM